MARKTLTQQLNEVKEQHDVAVGALRERDVEIASLRKRLDEALTRAAKAEYDFTAMMRTAVKARVDRWTMLNDLHAMALECADGFNRQREPEKRSLISRFIDAVAASF